MANTSNNKERIFGLDIMRCIAIVAVLVAHVYWIVGLPVSLNKFYRFNFDGVSIFFTLSGFLIGNILFKKLSEEDINFQKLISFWRARWWRTLPGYFFVLFLLIGKPVVEHQISFQQAFPYFFFLQNLHNAPTPIFGESWSLTVEEWFYLTMPVLLYVSAKFFNLKKSAPVVILIYFLAGWLFRLYKISTTDISTYNDYEFYIHEGLPTRIDAVMFGVLGSYLSFYNFKVWTNYRFKLFVLGLTGFMAQHEILYWNGLHLNAYILYFEKSAELFFCLCTIPYLSTIQKGKGFVARTISFIAVISYSIYLLHASVFTTYIRFWLPQNVFIKFSAYLLFAIGGGYIHYASVEKWGMRQREKRRKVSPQSNI